jgi:hypothetical protein
MTATDSDQQASAPRRTAGSLTGLLGLLGSIACVVSVILVLLGVGVSAAASGMAAMSVTGPGAPGGFFESLLRARPWLLIGSVVLVIAVAAVSRRALASVPAALAGVVLYVGMYV